jgi:hypothetical protein
MHTIEHAATRDSYTGREPFEFVSYAREDRNALQPALRRLWESGVRLWDDEGLRADQSFADEIEPCRLMKNVYILNPPN